uniref:Uncharacterized protein n=1 Tax=Arundo donax TaxID=35708 RepID=A0A0A9EXF0_ARUDO
MQINKNHTRRKTMCLVTGQQIHAFTRLAAAQAASRSPRKNRIRSDTCRCSSSAFCRGAFLQSSSASCREPKYLWISPW